MGGGGGMGDGGEWGVGMGGEVPVSAYEIVVGGGLVA